MDYPPNFVVLVSYPISSIPSVSKDTWIWGPHVHQLCAGGWGGGGGFEPHVGLFINHPPLLLSIHHPQQQLFGLWIILYHNGHHCDITTKVSHSNRTFQSALTLMSTRQVRNFEVSQCHLLYLSLYPIQLKLLLTKFGYPSRFWPNLEKLSKSSPSPHPTLVLNDF